MKHLVISDVHANLEALEAVLVDAGDYDAVLCLGDLAGYGPNPNEVVALIRELPSLVALSGNHDLAALGAVDLDLFNPVARVSAEWTAAQLYGKSREYLNTLMPAKRLDLQTTPSPLEALFLAHASPRDPVWEYMEETWQGPPNFELFEETAALVGHTHVPRVFEETQGPSRVIVPREGHSVNLIEGPRRIVNPGGVGQPRDGNPDAAYGVLDDATGLFEFRRIAYQIDKTQEKILRAGLPRQLAQRLALGL